MPRHRPKHLKHYALRRGIKFALLAVLALALIYPLAEPYFLRVESTAIVDETFPRDVRRLRVAYVTDLHVSGFPFYTKGRADGLLRQINALNPDLVLFGGDFTESAEETLRFFEQLRDRQLTQLHPTYGAYAVLGEHDRTGENVSLPELRTVMISAGVTPLINEVAAVRVGTSTIYLAGLDDVTAGKPDLSAVEGQLRRDDYVLFLCHSPEIIPQAMSATGSDGRTGWYDIGLFGHTHGGQVALGSLHIADGIESRYQYGWVTESRVRMLISGGIGTSVLPIRFLRTPTVHLLTLLSQ